MSNIAILNSHTLWPVHYETELEIIQNHLDAGDFVCQVVCNGISISDLNLDNSPLQCLMCIEKRKKGISLLNYPIDRQGKLNVIEYDQLTVEDRNTILRINFSYSTIDDLKALKVENFDIGLAVISSVVSAVRDSSLDVVSYKEIIDKYLLNSLMIFYSTKRIIEKYQITRYYVFNGRFAYPRAVLRACQQKLVDCYIHEVGGTIYKYEIFKNELPHAIQYTQQLIENFWNQGPSKERESLGHLWFDERINAIPQNYISFVSGQDPSKLPSTWDISKHNIVIFNSSEDEMVSVGAEWNNTLYKNQLDGIERVVNDLSTFPNIKVYLRMHPNLHEVNDDYVKGIKKIKQHNFELIEPLSPISTYQLIKNANKVVTFGSSTGIEAAYLCKVSVLLGASYYKGKSCVYEPTGHEDAIKILADMHLQPLISDFPLKFGYYFKNRGIDLKHYKVTKLHEGTFNNVNLSTFRSLKFRIMNHRYLNNRLVKKIMGGLYKRFILQIARM